jgi:hypothetical protein
MTNMNRTARTLALLAVALLVAGCASDSYGDYDYATSLSVGVGYSSGYYYPGYGYPPGYYPPPVVVAPPGQRPPSGGGGLPPHASTLPAEVGGGPSTKPSLPPSRPSTSTRPAPSASARPAPRPTPRPMGGRRR